MTQSRHRRIVVLGCHANPGTQTRFGKLIAVAMSGLSRRQQAGVSCNRASRPEATDALEPVSPPQLLILDLDLRLAIEAFAEVPQP